MALKKKQAKRLISQFEARIINECSAPENTGWQFLDNVSIGEISYSCKMHISFYVVFLIIGLSLTYFGIKQYLETRNLLSLGIVTTSEVVEFATVRTGDGDTYAPVFEYADRSGVKQRHQSKVSSAGTNRQNWREGQLSI